MKFVVKCVLIALMLINNVCNAQVVLRFQPEITKQASKLGDVLCMTRAPLPDGRGSDAANQTATVRKRNVCNGEKFSDWANIPLESHPTPGDIITRDKIIDWITQRIGHIDIIWQGKTQITVKQSTQSSGKMLVDKAKTALLQQLKPHYLRVDATPLSHLNDSEYALDTFKAESRQRFPTSTRVCVWLVNKKARIPVWFKVRAYTNVLVATRDLHSNHVIQKADVLYQERNIAGLNAPPATSFLPNAWLKSSIKSNAILLTNQVKAVPLTIHGQHIKVATHNHSITIIMDAIALADGYLGDTIAVKNPLNQKTFNAKITGSQQAEIAS